MADGLAKLAHALYRRPERPSDWLGGSEAQILHDAAAQLEQARALLNRWSATWYAVCNGEEPEPEAPLVETDEFLCPAPKEPDK